MRPIFAAAIVVFAASGALAQPATPPANPKPSTPAVTTHSNNNPGAPAAGANSFTESQAKSRIEAAGYGNVSALAKDKDGVWRGKATRAGASHDVSLDYQGNVVAK